MPVNKISADQFVNNLENGIISRNSAHDVEIGPIADIITEPTGQVLELQNDRIRTVSQLILLDQSAIFDDADVDSFVKNEEIFRNLGGRSSGTLIFSRASAPDADIIVQRGYPVATRPDESSGETVVFVTTESKTIFSATASSFFNLETERYELEIAIQATVAGQIGEVGPNRINRPLRPLNGFDSVFNRNRTSTTTDRETNTDLIERYKISIPGTQLSSKNGLKLFIISNFQDSGDVLVITGGNSLITRNGINGNAVDVFITGSQIVTRQDSKEFIGIGQLIVLDNQPATSVTNITGFILNTDYEFVTDISGVSNSNRSQNGIRFLSTATSLPTVGSVLTINYEQNSLANTIQNEFEANADNIVGGQDILIRVGTRVETTISAKLTVLIGFSFSTVQTAVIVRIVALINALNLGADVEESDLQAEIRQVSGVDNFVFSVLDRVGSSSNSDILIVENEFARILTSNITIIP